MKRASVRAETVLLNLDRYSNPIDKVGSDFDGVCTMARNLTNLSILSCTEINGTPVVNTVASVRACLDRVSLFAALFRKGIDVPESFVHRRNFGGIHFPAIIKNTVSAGAKGRRNIVLVSAKSVRKYANVLKNGVWLSQRLLPASMVTKVYIVGDDIIAIRHESTTSNGTKSVSENVVGRTTVDKCLACGRLFGLEVYNVELLIHNNHWYVIDVNDFPSFSGITNAPTIISNYLIRRFRK